ncbi:hypothetical protein Pelo_17921 [Pelomyxa schiedti]|nr:hypothetical protein Pelo_17921 [Pelomyxa schiedti]
MKSCTSSRSYFRTAAMRPDTREVMAVWKLTIGTECRALTPLCELTTRTQLGAIAAATVERCGAGSAMQRVMGRGHAATFVRVLWSDWVRPTITLFVLDLSGEYRSKTGSTDFTLWFAVSPLLMSLSHGPVATKQRQLRTLYNKVYTPRASTCASTATTTSRGALGNTSCTYNTKWVAFVRSYHNSTAAAAAAADGTRPITSATLCVAPMKGGVIIGCDGAGCDLERLVVVDIPVIDTDCVAMFLHVDQSVCCELIISQITGSALVVLVVDMEQTCNAKRLALLGTRRCDFHLSYMYFSLVVLRNWDQKSPAYGSRTFIVKSGSEIFHFAEGPVSHLVPTVINCYNCTDELFRVSDSLFGVSSSSSFKFYHRDNVAQQVQHAPSGQLQSNQYHGTGRAGFIFKVFTDMIEVVEPLSGLVVLTVNFPELQVLDLDRPPFSCFF